MSAPRTTLPDPNADYGRLWAAVHDYLVLTARQGEGDDVNAAEVGRAYAELVEAHNLIHDRYVPKVAPPTIAGVEG